MSIKDVIPPKVSCYGIWCDCDQSFWGYESSAEDASSGAAIIAETTKNETTIIPLYRWGDVISYIRNAQPTRFLHKKWVDSNLVETVEVVQIADDDIPLFTIPIPLL